jgi:deoxyguanosine kinase
MAWHELARVLDFSRRPGYACGRLSRLSGACPGRRPTLRERFYVAIEGAIGVGKTTLARLLKDRLRAELLLEVFEANPFLSSFYQDRARYAFQTQIFFLLSRYQQQNNVVRQTLERHALVSDYSFAKDRLFAHLNLAGDELEMYERVHAILARNIPLPDLIVYLRAGTDTLMQRIASRDRPYERAMSRQYIEELRRAYETFFADYNECPVLALDTDALNIVARPEDLDWVAGQIRAALDRQVYQPRLLGGDAGRPLRAASAVQEARRAGAPSAGDLYLAYIQLTDAVGQLGAQVAGVWAAQEQYELQAGNQIEARQRAVQERLPELRERLARSLQKLIEIAQLTGTDLSALC